MTIQHTFLVRQNGTGTIEVTDPYFTVGKAIRLKCLQCSEGDEEEITQCSKKYCALHPFRMRCSWVLAMLAGLEMPWKLLKK